MHPSDFRYGFRIVGGLFNERRLVDATAAFVGHAECAPQAGIENECYLSAFRFPNRFAKYLSETGSPKGYDGPTWAEWLWFDIDRHDIAEAMRDARRLVIHLLDCFELAEDDLLFFFSGSKGFHVGLPTSICEACPSIHFNSICRTFAEGIAERTQLAVDLSVYDRVRAFRAPNSRHAKSNRFKRVLSYAELMELKLDRILKLAESPYPFEIPNEPKVYDRALQFWKQASDYVDFQDCEVLKSKASISPNDASGNLNRSTMEFIRDGASLGDRHRRLFSAAANLAEFGCPFSLAWALLSEPALDCGLSPSEVRRQIRCGLGHEGEGS